MTSRRDAAPMTVAVVADGQSATELRTRLAALPGVARAIVVPFGHELAVDVAIVEIGSGDCAATLGSLERVALASRVLAIGPMVLSSRALRNGATGFLGYGDLELELPRALTAVLEGRRFLGSSVVEGYLADGLTLANAVDRLSARELEVLCRAGRGEDPMTTAEAIGVAPEAVTQYRLRARAKLGLDSTTQLAGFAVAHGLH